MINYNLRLKVTEDGHHQTYLGRGQYYCGRCDCSYRVDENEEYFRLDGPVLGTCDEELTERILEK